MAEFGGLGFVLDTIKAEHETKDTVAVDIKTELNTKTCSRGFKMMEKFGWKIGSGLGKHGQGISEPIRLPSYEHSLGIGGEATIAKDLGVSDASFFEERKLTVSEKLTTETNDERSSREQSAKKKEIIDAGVKERLFSCNDCNKHYKLVRELTIHLSSYDHHHTKRIRDMAEQAKRLNRRVDVSKRDEEQRKRDMERMLAQAKSATSQATVSAPKVSGINRMQMKGPIKLSLVAKQKNKPSAFSFASKKKIIKKVVGRGDSGSSGSMSIFGGKDDDTPTKELLPKRKVMKANKVNPVAGLFVKQSMS